MSMLVAVVEEGSISSRERKRRALMASKWLPIFNTAGGRNTVGFVRATGRRRGNKRGI